MHASCKQEGNRIRFDCGAIALKLPNLASQLLELDQSEVHPIATRIKRGAAEAYAVLFFLYVLHELSSFSVQFSLCFHEFLIQSVTL